MSGTGRKGTLKPDTSIMCPSCKVRPAGDNGSICSTCLIHKKRGVKVPKIPRPGYSKKR